MTGLLQSIQKFHVFERDLPTYTAAVSTALDHLANVILIGTAAVSNMFDDLGSAVVCGSMLTSTSISDMGAGSAAMSRIVSALVCRVWSATQ